MSCALVAQKTEEYWELTQPQLEKYIQDSNLIILGKKHQENIKIQEVLQGPQRIQTISIPSHVKLEMDREYILFLKTEDYSNCTLVSPKSIMKSDFFLLPRVKKAVMQHRMARTDQVVLARVEQIQETQQEENIIVHATCQTIKIFQGNLPEKFTIQFTIKEKAKPSQLYLFQNLLYVFFLKDTTLINLYEGAYLERNDIVQTLQILTSVENQFIEQAGKTQQGVRLIARTQLETIPKGKPVLFHILLQKDSEQQIELYHNQPEQFITAHIINQDGELFSTKPIQESTPEIGHYIQLHSYVFFPFSLDKYYEFQIGKYVIYIEYNVPKSYTGKQFQKTAWTGKLLSPKIEITIQ